MSNDIYKTKIKTVQAPKADGVEDKQVAMIVRVVGLDEKTTIEVPHPLTSFILSLSDSLNTQKKAGYTVCSFLNYINQEIENGNDEFIDLKNTGLNGLDWNHGYEFLTYSKEALGNKRDTLRSKADTLVLLYDYLIDNKVLSEDVTLTKTIVINDSGKAKEVPISPFKSGRYKFYFGQKEKPNKIKDLDSRLWNIFFETCEEIAPQLKLGAYLQFMGGLRAGEIVNLTIDALDIDYDNEEVYLDVRDRQGELFKDRGVRTDASQVKKRRLNQIVFNPYGDLIPILNNHLKLINDEKIRTKSPYENALFVNRDGNPMTGDNYSERFYKIKKAFLEKVKLVSYSEYKELSNTKWGTHIGRGIFTNFVINEGLADSPTGTPLPRVLADLRGDTSSTASEAYIESRTTVKNTREKINNLRNSLKNNIDQKEI